MWVAPNQRKKSLSFKIDLDHILETTKSSIFKGSILNENYWLWLSGLPNSKSNEQIFMKFLMSVGPGQRTKMV